MPVPTDPRVLVDYRTADDAGVYRLDGSTALVQTVDFFTPIVDEPYDYGRIAAANALSDVYAMGGRPLTALAIAAFPVKGFDLHDIEAIFRGGYDKLQEAGVALLGGHTVQDQEVKFGYAVTGVVRPDRVLTNAGARPGDRVLLTKAIGTGIISTAIKQGRAPRESVAAAVASMAELNRAAGELLAEAGPSVVHACTDITGFGLLGHLSEVAAASRVTIRLDLAAVPLLPGAFALAPANRPGGTATNRAHFGPQVEEPPDLDDDLRALLYDPQTSGGLLASVDPGAADELVRRLRAAGAKATLVGEVGEPGAVLVRLA